jgi:glycosyltransferase involved in cell wall biosynthesis
VRSLHQLVASMVPNDATANHTLEVRRALKRAGFHSEIFALAVHPALEDQVRLVQDLPRGDARTGLLYQFSSASPLADQLAGRRERLAVNFHNVTPPASFTRFEPGIRWALEAARVQLDQLARLQPLGICDSAVNAADLAAHGVRRRVVVPVLVDLAAFDAEPDPATAERLSAAPGPRWLFVGTVAPHKAQHELVQALLVHRRTYGAATRLSLVGRVISPAYAAALRRYLAAVGLTDAVELAGEVDHRQLVAHYRAADLFVTVSRHEGFCVPVLEAMATGLPVVARAAGALAETVGTGGVVLDAHAGPATVAAAADLVTRDPATRAALAERGRRRAAELSLERTAPRFVDVVERWLAGALDAAEPEGEH